MGPSADEVAMPEGIPSPADLLGEWVGVFVEVDQVDEVGVIVLPGHTTLFPGLDSYANNQDEAGYQLEVGDDGVLVETTRAGQSACTRHFALQAWDGQTGTLAPGPANGDCPDQFYSLTLSVVPQGLLVTAFFDKTVESEELGFDAGGMDTKRWRRNVYYSAPQMLVLEKATTSFFLENTTSGTLILSECVSWARVAYEPNGTSSGCFSGAPLYDSCEGMHDTAEFEASGHDDCHEQVELLPGATRKTFWSGAWREEVTGHGCCERWGPPAPAGEYFVTVSYGLNGECVKQTRAFLYPETESLEFQVEE